MTFECIPGGGESVITPKLVQDDQGRLAMQICIGPYSATLAIPDHLAGCSEERLQQFFDTVAPEMISKLHAMRRQDIKKRNRTVLRKALKKCSTGSSSSSASSPDETLPEPRRT